MVASRSQHIVVIEILGGLAHIRKCPPGIRVEAIDLDLASKTELPRVVRASAKLPPDPEGMNDRRVEWATSAICDFKRITGTAWEDALADLLCDLMHFADRNGFRFSHELARAQMHYEAETSPEGE